MAGFGQHGRLTRRVQRRFLLGAGRKRGWGRAHEHSKGANGARDFGLLLTTFLAGSYGVGAWRALRRRRALDLDESIAGRTRSPARGYPCFTLALMSPFNIEFWLAVVGSGGTLRVR